ncbi:MAG: hypothetical protein ACXVZX_11230 [Terriglobales bacterium]
MAKGLQSKKLATLVLLVVGLAACPRLCTAADDASGGAPPKTAADSGLYIKVQLAHPVKMSRLKPGDVVEGSLSRDVYSSDRKMFPSGSPVRLTVDHLEKRKRIPNDHWPWAVKVFTPRHESYPVFNNATIVQASDESSLKVSLISVSRMREVHPKAKKDKSPQQGGAETGAVELPKSTEKNSAAPMMVLEAFGVENASSAANSKDETASTRPSSEQPETLPAGTRCKILLLGNVSASKSKPGDRVQARLLEPVLLNSKVVLPAGTLFEGKVIKKTPPRMLSRAGSLYLGFTDITLPEGNHLPIVASIAGAELDERSHTRIDAEGGLRGERPGKAWMAINLGVTAGFGKVADDGMQLVIEAIISTATDVSTAGTGRIVAGCVSAIYLATRHGRDVIIPRFTEMDISLDRAVSLNAVEKLEPSGIAAGGK